MGADGRAPGVQPASEVRSFSSLPPPSLFRANTEKKALALGESQFAHPEKERRCDYRLSWSMRCYLYRLINLFMPGGDS
jgi:hypothetical protein